MLSAMINPVQAGELELTSDDRIITMWKEMIGEAISPGQLWILPLSPDQRPLGKVLVNAGLPHPPVPEDLHRTMLRLADEAPDATAAVYLLERTGAAGIEVRDLAWVEAICRTARVSRKAVHGVYLCHPGGFAVLSPVR
ncbi:hypothetical protein D1871_15560 [Nakamurella silvestris]|nr:hypothetical protein D1871_15560 [Nakamurella silvestris]